MVKANSPTRTSSVVADGKVRKLGEDQLEIQQYLSKLKQLVPNMPKNRKVSKVEVIEHVIDYICDLQTALVENHLGQTSAAALVSAMLNNNNNNNHTTTNNNNNSNNSSSKNDVEMSPASRQPLCVISQSQNATTCAQETQDKEKVDACGSRTVSC